MPFLENDYYLTRGDTKLLQAGNWQDTVYKYDASSFYNWEQDNLPLYDLEDRTETNWEEGGYVGSSITGVQLVVSGTAGGGPPYQIFDSLQGTLDALPRTIRFPVVVEVAATGSLGDIEIADFEFVEGGGLEIINRGFAKALCASGTAQNTLHYASGTLTSSISQFSSVDLSNTINQTSSLAVSSGVSALFTGTYNRTFIRLADYYSNSLATQNAYGTAGQAPAGDERPNNITVNICNTTSPGFLSDPNPDPYIFAINRPYEANSKDYAPNAPSYGLRESDVDNLPGTSHNITGMVYVNTMDSLKIKNCNGKIYVRGFCVDGGTGESTTETAAFVKEEGIVVENSNVVLENCAVMRCKEAGARFSNSQVVLNRGFSAYRNYDLTGNSASTRTDNAAYGMVAYNSDIMLSGASDVSAGLAIDSPFTFSQNHTGIQLNNSTLRTPFGGRGYTLEGVPILESTPAATLATIPYRQLYADIMLNTNIGLECNNSTVDVYHTLMVYQNTTGIKATNSNLILDEIVCDHNSEVGMETDSCTVEYYRTKHGYVENPLSGRSYVTNKILSFLSNGKNLSLTNSTFKEPPFSNFIVDGLYNQYEIEGGGYKKIGNEVMPGVTLDNSVCRLLMIDSFNGISEANYAPEGTYTVGSAYRADSNSYLKFMGASAVDVSNTQPETYIGGVSAGTYTQQLDTVTVYADNNSTVEFNGPTRFNRAGINVGANNNSAIKFLPHNEDGVIDASSFNLSDTNMHTKVMAQSYKACFAANNNSTILMQDCGDYIPYWRKSSDSYVANDLILSSTYNPNDIEGFTEYVSGGFIQFFPNPIMDHQLTALPFVPRDNHLSGIFPTMDASNMPITVGGWGDTEYYKYSQGGYCVRADKGSEVTVKNVHFPCGFENPSSTILDASAGASGAYCGKVFIWGIGDDSRLHASHIVVSGNYPEDVGYSGPSGVHVSASVCDGIYLPLSAAPSTTPYTGIISVLDSFGPQPGFTAGVTYQQAIPERATPANKGPFRIYFSVDPVAKFLGYVRGTAPYQTDGAIQVSSNVTNTAAFGAMEPSAVEVGEPYQELSQGYNPSRDCSATAPGEDLTSISGIHQGLAFQNASYEALSTTFFYVSSMVDPSYESRIWLDDSAMNTFANAKNAARANSGRPRLVSYYRATYNKYGAGYVGESPLSTDGYRETYGVGFKSSNIFDFEDEV